MPFINFASISDLSYVAPLNYLEFHNGHHSYVALIDNGSQINLIDKSILRFIQYVPMPNLVHSFAGVQGKQSSILEWASFPLHLSNGTTVNITAAVVEDCPCAIILGQPFLILNDARIDSANAVLTTKKGPIKLLQQKRPPPAFVKTVTADRADGEEMKLDETNLTDEQEKKLRQFLQNYRSLWGGENPGRVKHVQHRIQLIHDKPIRDRPRYHSPDQNSEIDKQLSKMLQDGIIQPSKSPYSSEIVIAKKADSDGNFTGWRFCIDFRNINKATIKDAYPLPRITDLLHAIRGAKYFVALDLRSGYWNIPMDIESVKYTAFRCLKGLYEFLVMPFGLTNAPATFQRLMDFLLGDLRYNGVLAYLDDILIHGDTFEEVLGKLKIVLDRLAAEGLKINLEKSHFFPLTLKYLGHIIKNGNLQPNPAKVEVLNRIRTPHTVHDVKRLLGILGYYHSYIHHYSELMAPIFELLKRSSGSKKSNQATKITWTTEHEQVTQEAINRLKASVLALPLESDEFVLETDASNISVAATLQCRKKDGTLAPVEFASKKLTATERRWPIRDREAFAIIVGLKKFDTYLRGRSFVVHTDHKSLKWMLDAKEGRVARWASRLTEYDITIYHKKGQTLEHVDYLTRFVDDTSDFDLEDHTIYQVNSIRASIQNLPPIQEIIRAQDLDARPCSKGFFTKEGITYFHNCIWVPTSLQMSVIAACHSVAPFRHHGIKKTERILRRVFNWPGLHVDVVKYISSCLPCQRKRVGTERLQGLFRTHPIPGPFHTVYMDFWQCTFNTIDYKLLTLIDQFTKWAECIPIPATTAPIIVSAFIRSWICRFGVPEVIMCDNDRTLIGNLLQEIHSTFGTKSLSITPRHPEGNAVIESFHRVLRKGLSSFEAPSHRPTTSFYEALDLVLYSYRSTIHSTMGDSPGFLTYGIDLRPPADNDWRFCRSTSMKERLKFLNEMRLDIQWKAYDQRIRENQVKNQGRQPVEFELYQLILVKANDYDRTKYAHFSNEHKHKLIPKWSLPHRVTSVYPGKKKALARDLLTQKERHVHIQDVRFIKAPLTHLQREEWDKILVKEIDSMFDPQVRREKLDQFWEAIEFPQFTISPPSGKRRRV
jgi:hypothetical protein